MKQITCYVGLLKPMLELPIEPLTLYGRSISTYFRIGSQDENGNPDIDLEIDAKTRLKLGQIPGNRPTDTYYLNKFLRNMLKNLPWAKAVNRIGLIFADEFYRRKGVLGLMFDFGFNPSGFRPVDEIFTSVPREGCVVFLNAIKRLRGNGVSYRKEAVFTAIHELGHVFNLWHKDTYNNFMSSSHRDSVLPPRAFRFSRVHREFLQKCSKSKYVWPGGSRFEDRDMLGPSLGVNAFNLMRSSIPLNFNISISQSEFWHFEPIEMDLKIEINPGTENHCKIPDKVDPGYNCFDIWIDAPDGSRYKYLSPRIYCQNFDEITIEPNKDFKRDISIFAQSGGYTFKMPGVHTIQAVLTFPDETVLFSNPVEVNIKPPMFNSLEYNEMVQLLTDRKCAKLLYHRNGFPWRSTIEPLKQFCEKTKNKELKANLHYALGCFMAKNSYGKSKPVERRYANLAKYHFAAALEYENLSECRKIHSLEFME